MAIHFTADTHFGHENVIAMDGRPFGSAEEMDEELVRRWNETVRKGDIVYHLGDFAMSGKPEYLSSIAERLNGKIRLVFGNHDSGLRRAMRNGRLTAKAAVKFEDARDYREVRHDHMKFLMSHYPMPCYNGRHHTKNRENETIFMLHGHVHATPEHDMIRNFAIFQKPAMQIVNVGCMLWDYRPISPEQAVSACRMARGCASIGECVRKWGMGDEGCAGCAFGSYRLGADRFGCMKGFKLTADILPRLDLSER